MRRSESLKNLLERATSQYEKALSERALTCHITLAGSEPPTASLSGSRLELDEAFERVMDRCSPMSNGCLEWGGARDTGNYGVISVGGKTRKVHRIACEFTHGSPPPGKTNTCHHCDNPPCVNPEHLYWGSQSDNMLDATRRGRASMRPAIDAHVQSMRSATHCKRGHEYTDANTFRRLNGSRNCRACRKLSGK